MGGGEWVLRAFGWDEPAPETPVITLTLDGTRVAGSAGCNRYFAGVTAGDQPGAITVGHAGSTRMTCPEAQMAVETRFLEQLAGVRQIGFVGGQLALQYTKKDGAIGVMLFGRRAKP
jgi:heat shock protein HslJ